MISVGLIVTFILYFKFLFFGHISWDDPEMVFKNDLVKHFDLKGLFSGHFVGNYIPVTMTVHAITWFLFENSDAGHHLINLLFHCLNGILVYQLGRRLFKSQPVASIGALIFLLHPLQIESVGWISELKNILSGTFYLAGLLAYLNYKENPGVKNYVPVFMFFILGCLSKSSVVVFPLSAICLDMLIDKKLILKTILNKLPLFLCSLIFGYVNIKTQTADLFINHAHEFPYYQRFGLAGFALLKYLILFLFPVNLSVIYPYPEIKTAVFVTGYFMLLIIIGSLFWLFRRNSFTIPALLLFVLVNLILVLQILPFGEVLYADRYAYIPLIGLGWIAGLLFLKAKINQTLIATVLLALLGICSFSRVVVWKSALNLYEDILKKYPTQFIALNSAGVECMFLNEDAKALDYLNKAVSAAPRNYKGFYNRGLLFLKNKKPELAIKSFNETIGLYDYAKAYTGRASAYYMLGDIPKAMNDANTALQKDAGSSKAHFVLGNCYNDLNKLDEASREYNKCIELNGNEADFYFKRAIVSGKKQDFKSCLNDLTVCLQLNPLYYEAYYWRGVAKVNLNQNPCEDLKIAARNNFEPAVKAYYKYCK